MNNLETNNSETNNPETKISETKIFENFNINETPEYLANIWETRDILVALKEQHNQEQLVRKETREKLLDYFENSEINFA